MTIGCVESAGVVLARLTAGASGDGEDARLDAARLEGAEQVLKALGLRPAIVAFSADKLTVAQWYG